jgi:hypothetical protein
LPGDLHPAPVLFRHINSAGGGGDFVWAIIVAAISIAVADLVTSAVTGGIMLAMDRNFTARGHHDMGGLDAGEIDRNEHDYALWEKRVDAMMMLLTNKLQIMTVDQLRKGIEGLPPDAYQRMSYYERWIASVTNTLLDAGVISTDELSARMAAVEARGLGASESELNQKEAG